MKPYLVVFTLIGLAGLGMAWMPSLAKKTGISYSVVYMVAGMIVFSLFPQVLPSPLPQEHASLTLHLTEIIVIISLMGTGIKIDRSFSFKKWATPLKLVLIAMVLCIAAATFGGYVFLGFSLASAVLLGAVLAPTDPVLAADVQVGPPNEKQKSETKFGLTAEAGLNDGTAFPFVWLAITLCLMANGEEASLLTWFGLDLLYKVAAGLIIGYLCGRFIGYLVFTLSEKFSFLRTSDGFLALSLTFLVYGIVELANGYGFIAVFITGLTLRHYEKGHHYHEELHSFTDQAERFFIAVLLLLFGGALVSGVLSPLTWQMACFSLLFLFVVRPIAAYLCLFNANMHLKEKIAISFFGIRGMGSIFYLAFGFQEADFLHQEELWATVAFTILISIVVHGFTATRIMQHLKENIEKGAVPE
jgi:NhaP-type Na+/H+ or K+/H+ antiporter